MVDEFERALWEIYMKGKTKLAKERKDRFVIENWNNLYQFFKIFFSNNIIPFSLHQQRCKNALEGFLDHGFTRTIYKYLTKIDKDKSLTSVELSNNLNRNTTSVLKTLKKKQYIRFIEIKGKGVNRNLLIISITREGKEFLRLIEQIREVYNEKCRSE